MSDTTRKLFADEIEQRLDEVLFASPSHRSSKHVVGGLEKLPRTQQEAVLHKVGVAAQSYSELGHLVAVLAPRALHRLDAAGFEAWVLAALDAYDHEGGAAALDRLRDLDAFCARQDLLPRAARLSDQERRIGRFLQGLSGRVLGLASAEYAHTDTETVFLPEHLDSLPSAAENRSLYKVLATLLWAQTRYGTFGSAAVDVEAGLSAWPDHDRALRWFAVLETIRLEAVLGAELPGLAAEIARLHGPWPASLERAVQVLGQPDAAVSRTLTFLAECMALDIEPPELPHVAHIDLTLAAHTRRLRVERSQETVRRALSNLKGVGGKKGSGQIQTTVNFKAGKLEVSLDGEEVELPPEAQSAAQALLQDLGELDPDKLSPAGPSPWRPSEGEQKQGQEIASSADEPLRRYDEWDYRRNAYRRDWCHLYEVALPPGKPGYVEEVSRRYTAQIKRIRRRFELLKGDARLLGRQFDGEEFDLDALVEAAGDRRAGVEPPANVYARRVRNERSLAAMFMVDMSGSTKGWVNNIERESLVMLCEALETLGDAYAIYGFSGSAHTRCEIYPVKRFAERYDAGVRSRIAAIQAKDYTRMGVAIRHLTRLLAAQAARYRLLVTLSDGRPYDLGEEYHGHYGIEDTRRALQEAHRGGVRSYCVTIDPQGADYLPRMYGPAHYTVIDKAAKLPLKVADIYRRLTT